MRLSAYCGIARKAPWFQYLATLTGILNIVCSGMHYGWLSPSLPQLMDEDSTIPTTSEDGSWLAVLLPVGTICGALLGAIILDIIGRKNCILLTSVPFVISWLMMAFGQSVPVFYTGRFIAGIADGLGFGAVPLYLCEIANANIRGLLGSGVKVGWMFGMLLMDIIGSRLDIKTAALISAAVPVISFVTFCWMPESPYFLIMKGKLKEARNSLVQLKGTGDVDGELNRLVEAVEEQNRDTGKYLDLFTVESNRKGLIVSVGSRGFQQLSGVIAITFYAQVIFKHAGNGLSPSAASNIYFAMQFLFTVISALIIDKTGRKPLMIFSITGSGLVLFTIGTFFSIQNLTEIDTSELSLIPIVALVAFVIVFNIGMQTTPTLLAGEIFPTNVKSFAACLSNICFSVVVIALSKVFQATKDKFGLHVPFFMFTVFCILGLIFIIFYVPETKGKTLEEIQVILKGSKSRQQPKQKEPEIVKNHEYHF